MSSRTTQAQKKFQNRLDYMLSMVPETALRSGLEREIAKLRMNRKFGLVFEEHMPEHVRLYQLPVTVGARVVLRDGKGDDVFNVIGIEKKTVQLAHEIDGHWEDANMDDVVVIKKFGEPVYPSLTPVDQVFRAKDKPFHSIINAENFHALQLLLYCYEGKVDVIYIDPPYNTGAKDWKYNNNYVDSNDQYRHSKWLSMMKSRLLLSKRLLKKTGILCVTIDDCEEHHLKCLLEQIGGSILGTIVIKNNPSGRSTVKGVSISHEYALLVAFSENAQVSRLERSEKQKARYDQEDQKGNFEWVNFRKHGGANSFRTARPRLFYPFYIKGNNFRIPKMEWNETSRKWSLLEEPKKDEIIIWPVNRQREERTWKWGHTTVLDNPSEFMVRKDQHDDWAMYLKSRMNEEGLLPLTVWDKSEYSSTEHGTNSIREILGESNRFPFPKSLYAVTDCLRVAGAHENALILDFFAGSGTTLHSTCLLNAEDGGNRQCILVTNNEVSEKLANDLEEKGIFRGNPKFEEHGICESVTWPRCKYVVNGKRDDGTVLSGEYLSGERLKDGFDENIQYLRMEYLNPNDVAYREKLSDILPILWLAAGAKGKLESVTSSRWFIPKHSSFAVLMDETSFAEFKREIVVRNNVSHIFIVTDSEEAYREMSALLPNKFKTKMLYKSYLENFRINTPQNL